MRIYNPLSGKVIPITDVKDDAAVDKMLREAATLLLESDNIVVPADRKTINTNTYHTIVINAIDGVEPPHSCVMGTLELDVTFRKPCGVRRLGDYDEAGFEDEF